MYLILWNLDTDWQNHKWTMNEITIFITISNRQQHTNSFNIKFSHRSSLIPVNFSKSCLVGELYSHYQHLSVHAASAPLIPSSILRGAPAAAHDVVKSFFWNSLFAWYHGLPGKWLTNIIFIIFEQLSVKYGRKACWTILVPSISI